MGCAGLLLDSNTTDTRRFASRLDDWHSGTRSRLLTPKTGDVARPWSSLSATVAAEPPSSGCTSLASRSPCTATLGRTGDVLSVVTGAADASWSLPDVDLCHPASGRLADAASASPAPVHCSHAGRIRGCSQLRSAASCRYLMLDSLPWVSFEPGLPHNSRGTSRETPTWEQGVQLPEQVPPLLSSPAKANRSSPTTSKLN
ncbi:hypothetical protein BOX15_Mlig028132g1 [Macrostomum lignano]|uniref:Uncharacterized protein n=1 Tax=Macrostomum lignano TaxID=282301 RepID=A0A267F2E3_9PLAT|nr:hypothetical protein BOX15_Mlig028132g1 [Macrostomum lignano]